MIHDYLELPEVVFLTHHWLGILVFDLVVGALAWRFLRPTHDGAGRRPTPRPHNRR